MPTSDTPGAPTLHTVRAGETLDGIAERHFGDPTRWRELADANNLSDPLALRPGMVLKIPDRPRND